MDLVHAGGCIRLYDTGPEWHINTRHATVGFDTSTPPTITADGDLYVSLVETMTVVSAAANVDETLAAKGVWAGISGGVSGCTIRLRKDGIGRLDLNEHTHYSAVRGSLSNLWLTVLRVPEPEVVVP
jgi:hypothetical protein